MRRQPHNPQPTHRPDPRHRAPVPPSKSVARSRRTVAAVAGVALISVGMPAALAVTGNVAGKTKNSPAKAAVDELIVNGDFENGTTGWKVNRTSAQQLTTAKPAASGAAAAQLTHVEVGNVVVNDVDPTIISTTAGRSYAVSAYVRATGADIKGKIRIREIDGGAELASFTAPFTAVTGTWTRVDMTYTSTATDAKLDLNVVGRKVDAGAALLVDDVSMKRTTATATATASSATASPSASQSSSSTPKPSSSAPTSPTSSATTSTPSVTPTAPTPSATPPSQCVSNAMGIPANGQTYLGAAVSGGNTIEARESQLGKTMRVHRTYYSSGQINSAVRTATEDVNAGRLPWISFKAPSSWSAMAGGAGDAWVADLADGLKTVPGPVWLAVHHEPEKDGDMSQWTAMQARIAPIIHARSDNVAYTVIYSGWNTFGGGTNTLASKWPGNANVDVTAIDAYNDYGVLRGGTPGQKHLDIRAYYVKLAAWAEAHGTAWGVAETGQSISGAKSDPTWLTRAYEDMRELGGSALSYFDSNENSVSDWRLNDPVKFNQFKTSLGSSARIC